MGCCSFVLHGFMELKNFRASALETPRWGVSRARGTGCSNCSFTAPPRAAPYGVLLFLFCMDFMEQGENSALCARGRAVRLQKRPGGAFLGAGHGLFELLFTALLLSSTLWGAAFLFCMDFMELVKEDSNRNAPVGRF